MLEATSVNKDQLKEQTAEGQDSAVEPRILGILCNWCSYAGADLAGSARLKYPANVRIVRVPCSGRVNPQYVLKGFMRGFDGVLVSGCHPGDCHYAKGNYYARRRLTLLKKFLAKLGIEEERFQFQWVSASEGNLWAESVSEMTERLKKLGPFRGVTSEGVPDGPGVSPAASREVIPLVQVHTGAADEPPIPSPDP
ncbi:MAG: hydrogenase iron-sulfur subunit [Armatimonadetes bacterium]|nr:hydrogenase iron-sulfur subunit [Armatimonadota bacterium]